MPWKSFSKICRSESTLNSRSCHSRIKLTHTAWVYEKLGRNPDWRVVMANYVCMYVQCFKNNLLCPPTQPHFPTKGLTVGFKIWNLRKFQNLLWKLGLLRILAIGLVKGTYNTLKTIYFIRPLSQIKGHIVGFKIWNLWKFQNLLWNVRIFAGSTLCFKNSFHWRLKFLLTVLLCYFRFLAKEVEDVDTQAASFRILVNWRTSHFIFSPIYPRLKIILPQ